MVKFVLPPIESAPTGRARGLKAHDVAAAMKAVISALAGGVITPGEAATIAAALAMPDLDQIKQGEQGCETGAGWVVDTFVRAIEISDFDRRLPLVETDCFNDSGAVTGMHDAGPGGYFDP